jgi:hypothetical protein
MACLPPSSYRKHAAVPYSNSEWPEVEACSLHVSDVAHSAQPDIIYYTEALRMYTWSAGLLPTVPGCSIMAPVGIVGVIRSKTIIMS